MKRKIKKIKLKFDGKHMEHVEVFYDEEVEDNQVICNSKIQSDDINESTDSEKLYVLKSKKEDEIENILDNINLK